MKSSAFHQYRRVLWAAPLLATLLLLAVFSSCASKTPEEKLDIAAKYFRQGAIFDCISICEDLIQTAPIGDPAQKKARALAAECYLRTSQMDRARAYWSDIVSEYGIQGPLAFGAFDRLMRSYILDPQIREDKEKQRSGGERALKEIAEKRKPLKRGEPYYLRTRFLEADLLNLLERTTDTLRVYTETIEDETTTTVAKFQVAQRASILLGGKRMFAEAIAWNEEQIKHFKDTDYETETHLILCQLNQNIGNEEQTEKYLKLTFDALDAKIAGTPGADSKIGFMRRKAEALKTLDRFDEAADVYRQAVEKYPKSKSALGLMGLIVTTYTEKGRFHFKKRDKEKANAAYEQALAQLNIISEKYADDPRIRDGVYRAINQTREAMLRQLPDLLDSKDFLTSDTLNAGATSGTLDPGASGAATTGGAVSAPTTPTASANE